MSIVDDKLKLLHEDAKEKDDVDWDQYLFDDEEGYKVKQPKEQTEEIFEGSGSRHESMYDNLCEQLTYLKLSAEETLVGEYIIGNIGPDGYLSISVSEMAAELQIEASLIEPAETGMLVSPDSVTFVPTGAVIRPVSVSMVPDGTPV